MYTCDAVTPVSRRFHPFCCKGHQAMPMPLCCPGLEGAQLITLVTNGISFGLLDMRPF